MQNAECEGLRLVIGDRYSEPVTDLETASRVYQRLRDASTEGASTWPAGRVTESDGNFVARICFNGLVWRSETHTPGQKPVQEAATVVPLTAERIALDMTAFCGPVNRWLEHNSFGPLTDDMRARFTNPERYHEGTSLLWDLASDPGVPWQLLAPIARTMALGRARLLLLSGPLSLDTLREVAQPLRMHRGATFVDFVEYVDHYTIGGVQS